METSSSLPPQRQTKEQASMVMLRGRDKRRHLSASAVDLRDPFELISLAVRFDESRENETLLRVPLERGSFYDTRQFVEVFEFLREQTKPSIKRSKRLLFLENNQQVAITPIILSGMLSTIQGQREISDKDAYSMSLSSELVSTCQTMRQAALSRLRKKKKRGRAQRVIIPLFCVMVLFTINVRRLMEMRELVIQLGFVDSCDDAGLNVFTNNSTKEYYNEVCRISEAYFWGQYKAYTLTLEGSCSAGEDLCHHHMLHDHYREAPFSMHTALSRELITLEDLGLGAFSSFMASINRNSNKSSKTNEKTGISWLGDTNVNKVVVQAIEEYLPPNADQTVLDVGCGVGGSLYPLLFSHTSNAETNRSFRYHGIALSRAEVEFAGRLAAFHDIPSDMAAFEQNNFDAPLSFGTFSVILAIDSLSYSPNIEVTLSNLMKSLRRGGIVIIVDVVVVAGQHEPLPEGDLRLQPYHFTHAVWVAALNRAGCSLELARDLSLEYEVASDMQLHPFTVYWDYRIPFLQASKSSATRRVVALADDLVNVSREKARRDEAFKTAELSYNMYICRKI